MAWSVSRVSVCRANSWKRETPRSKDHQALRKNGDSTRPRRAYPMRASAAWLSESEKQVRARKKRGIAEAALGAADRATALTRDDLLALLE